MKTFSSFLTKVIILSFVIFSIVPVASLIVANKAFATAVDLTTPLAEGATCSATTADCDVGLTCTAGKCTASTGRNVSSDVNNNILVTSMCNAMKLVTGNAGKAFAGFAIISLGIGFFTGKISWGLMIGVAMGIAGMFGAPTIVAALTGKSAYDCGS